VARYVWGFWLSNSSTSKIIFYQHSSMTMASWWSPYSNLLLWVAAQFRSDDNSHPLCCLWRLVTNQGSQQDLSPGSEVWSAAAASTANVCAPSVMLVQATRPRHRTSRMSSAGTTRAASLCVWVTAAPASRRSQTALCSPSSGAAVVRIIWISATGESNMQETARQQHCRIRGGGAPRLLTAHHPPFWPEILRIAKCDYNSYWYEFAQHARRIF